MNWVSITKKCRNERRLVVATLLVILKKRLLNQSLQTSLNREGEKSGEAHSHFLNVVPGIKCGTLAVFLTLGARVALRTLLRV